MRVPSSVLLASISLLGAACGGSKQEGLPPATEWQSANPGLLAQPMPSKPQGMPSNDPHAGMLGGNPGAAAADPHAGVPGAPPLGGNPGAPAAGDDPHAGVIGAPPLGGNAGAAPMGDPSAAMDVTQLGLSSPDPNRPIDPNRRITGTLKLAPAVAARVKPGTTIYFMVRKPHDNQPTGALIVTAKATWSADGQSFELTERDAMVAGAPDLIGDLFVGARIDQDEDAMTKQPGDVTGWKRITVPATGIVLDLDTVL